MSAIAIIWRRVEHDLCKAKLWFPQMLEFNISLHNKKENESEIAAVHSNMQFYGSL